MSQPYRLDFPHTAGGYFVSGQITSNLAWHTSDIIASSSELFSTVAVYSESLEGE